MCVALNLIMHCPKSHHVCARFKKSRNVFNKSRNVLGQPNMMLLHMIGQPKAKTSNVCGPKAIHQQHKPLPNCPAIHQQQGGRWDRHPVHAYEDAALLDDHAFRYLK